MSRSCRAAAVVALLGLWACGGDGGGSRTDGGSDAAGAGDVMEDAGTDAPSPLVDADGGTRRDAAPDAPRDVPAPPRDAADAEPDAEWDADRPLDASGDGGADARDAADARDEAADAPGDATADVAPDTAPDSAPDAPADAAPDVSPDAAPDVPADAAPDAAPDVPPDGPDPGCGPDGTPCDDGVDCTVDDACADDVCQGRADHARCDTGNPCTRGLCRPTLGGCETLFREGLPCFGAAVCDEGRCAQGDCVFPATPCDDGLVCTADACDGAGCGHPLQERVGQPAPAFTAPDVNPLSATEGEAWALPLAGGVTVLVFHEVDCPPCVDQGEAARALFAALAAEPDLAWVTVNGPLSLDPADVDAYVTHETDDVPPLTTTWPVLQDDARQRTWERYCAENDDVILVDRGGVIVYDRRVNFLDAPFRFELELAIRAALAAPP